MMPRHGGQPHAFAGLTGKSPGQVIDFSASINPDGPPASVVAALQAALTDPTSLTRYPDLENGELKQALAAYAGCAVENVAVANGFVPLLEAALQVLPIRSCVVPVPAFNEYRRALEHLGIAIEAVALIPAQNFAYDADQLLASTADAVLLANPQNPTGVLTPAAALRSLIQRAARQGKYVLLDEAFIDYAPGKSLAGVAAQHANLVVFRSVTKCFGIPGLRVAYAVAERALAQAIVDRLAPWPCTNLAASGVIAAVGDTAFIASFAQRNADRRAVFQAGLEQLGFHVYPAAANYLLLHAPALMDVRKLWGELASKGFLLRSCENFEATQPGHLRVAVRSDADNALLLAEVARLLSSCSF